MEREPFYLSPRGMVLRIRLRPSSSRQGISGVLDDSLIVSVHSPPEKGKANREALKVLADQLGIPVSRLEITSGLTSRHKTVLVKDLDRESLENILNNLISFR